MLNPNVSIIIPMRNESRYIARCLDSLNNQTYKDFEIILIDDGSTDNTIEIASKYDAKILKQQH
jgi:glycosyltransferase involved in cell wall biosynthesis